MCRGLVAAITRAQCGVPTIPFYTQFVLTVSITKWPNLRWNYLHRATPEERERKRY